MAFEDTRVESDVVGKVFCVTTPVMCPVARGTPRMLRFRISITSIELFASVTITLLGKTVPA